MADEVKPEPAQPDEPKGWLAKLGAALPVALAAVATTFAGMSSGEMARAMFWRSAAAQDQAKAASQWTLAGFKRDRSLITEAAAASLRATAGGATWPARGELPEPVRSLAARWPAGDGRSAATLPPVTDPRIRDVLDGIRERLPETDLVHRAAGIPPQVIDDTIREAEQFVARTEEEWDQAFKPVEGADVPQAVRFDLQSRRYVAEAKLNQAVSRLYEVRVRKTTAESERHRRRSENFFYAMLVAQVGATGGSLALARHRRSALWLFAGLTGLVSVAFGGYVYLTM